MTAKRAKARTGRPEVFIGFVGVDIRGESRRRALVCRKGWRFQQVVFVPHAPTPSLSQFGPAECVP
jgi:hypothetical protein